LKRSWVALLAVLLVVITAVIVVLFGPFLAVVMRGSMCDYSLEQTFDLFIEFAAYVLPTGIIIGAVGGLIVGAAVVFAQQTDKRTLIIIGLGGLSISVASCYGCTIGSFSLIADCI
jgi:hypothetical protein